MGILHKNRKSAVEKKQAGGTIPFYTSYQVRGADYAPYDPSNLLKKYSAPATTKSKSSDTSDLKIPELNADGLESEVMKDVDTYRGLKNDLSQAVAAGYGPGTAVYRDIIDNLQEHVTISNSRRANTMKDYTDAQASMARDKNDTATSFTYNSNGDILVASAKQEKSDGSVTYGEYKWVKPWLVNTDLTDDQQRKYNPLTAEEALKAKRFDLHDFWTSSKGAQAINSIKNMMSLNTAFKYIDDMYKDVGTTQTILTKDQMAAIENVKGLQGDAKEEKLKTNEGQLGAAFANLKTRLKGSSGWNAIKTALELSTGSTEGDGGAFDFALNSLLINDQNKRLKFANALKVKKRTSAPANQGDPSGKKSAPTREAPLKGVTEVNRFGYDQSQEGKPIKTTEIIGSTFLKSGDLSEKDLTITLKGTDAPFITKELRESNPQTLNDPGGWGKLGTAADLSETVILGSNQNLKQPLTNNGKTIDARSYITASRTNGNVQVVNQLIDKDGNIFQPNVKGLEEVEKQLKVVDDKFEALGFDKLIENTDILRKDKNKLAYNKAKKEYEEKKRKIMANFLTAYTNDGVRMVGGIMYNGVINGEGIIEALDLGGVDQQAETLDVDDFANSNVATKGLFSSVIPYGDSTDEQEKVTWFQADGKTGTVSGDIDDASPNTINKMFNNSNIQKVKLWTPLRSSMYVHLSEGDAYTAKADYDILNLAQFTNNKEVSIDKVVEAFENFTKVHKNL